MRTHFPATLGVILGLLLLAATGCTSAPNGGAGEYHRRLSVFGVVSTADLTGVKKTDATIKAESAKWSLAFPGFDLSWELKDVMLKPVKDVTK